MKPARHSTIIVSLILLFYVGSYSLLYVNRHPAANLMYFVYLRNDMPEGAEYALFYFYYPVYRLHVWMGGGKHNYDRSREVAPKGFNG